MCVCLCLKKNLNTPRPSEHPPVWRKIRTVVVCVCVVFQFILDVRVVDVPAGVTQQEEGHTGFLIHLPSAVLALFFFARRIQPFLSLVDLQVEFLCTNKLIVLHLLGIYLVILFYFIFCKEKSQFVWLHRDSNSRPNVRRFRDYQLYHQGDRHGVHLFIPSTAIGPVPSLSSNAIACRWRSLPRVRRPRASSPRGSSSNGCCLFTYSITMTNFLCTSALVPHALD